MQLMRVTSRWVLFLFFTAGLSTAGAESHLGDEVLIPDGTEVVLKLKHTLSSKSTRTDDPVFFEAVEDVVIDGVVVIAQGAEARGSVTEARRKKSFGRSGKLAFTIDVVETVDEQNLPLRIEKTRRGKERYGTAGVVTWLTGPFGIFVRGKNVDVPSGTEYTIFIDGERRVRLTS